MRAGAELAQGLRGGTSSSDLVLVAIVREDKVAVLLQKYMVSPWMTFWAFAGIAANAIMLFGDHPERAQVSLGVLGVVHSVVYFWKDGGERITAPGVYLIGSGLFAFFPAIAMVVDARSYPDASTLVAVNIAYWVQMVLVHLFWEPRATELISRLYIDDKAVTNWGSAWAIALFSAGLLAARFLPGVFGSLGGSAVFAGVVLLAVSLFRRPGRVAPFHYLLVAMGMLAYIEFVFEGFGRLNLGALGIAVVLAASPRWGFFLKLSVLFAFPPVLAYLAADRVAFTAGLNPNQDPSVTGLESVIGPFVRFSQTLLLESMGELPWTWGSSFLVALVALIPRSLWPDKPLGFGADVALFFRPELAGVGHSELVLFYGEWVWALGFVGLVVMVPVIGGAVRVLDAALLRTMAARTATRQNLLAATAAVLLAASLVDLFWGGAFTYVARVGPRVLVLGVPLLAALLGVGTRQRRGADPRRSRGQGVRHLRAQSSH